MTLTKLRVEVAEVRGRCPAGLREGESFILEGFYIQPTDAKICLHALVSMATLLSAMSHGSRPEDLGIGRGSGYLQCPDPGPPLTEGGTVIFRITPLGPARVEEGQ